MLNRRRMMAERVAARRQREDEAPRLHAEVPLLTSLSLTIEERHAGMALGPSHVRRVVVEHAPALLVLPCCAPRCDGGTHELTSRLLAALRRGDRRLEGEVMCDLCDCLVRYTGEAAYR